MPKKKTRKTRSDCTVGTFEKTRGIPEGSLRHPSGRKMRKDKTVRSIREQYGDDKL